MVVENPPIDPDYLESNIPYHEGPVYQREARPE
jgi:hypothetical protein